MLFKPAQLGLARLDPAELAADRKAGKENARPNPHS